jgi:hypothetical protein
MRLSGYRTPKAEAFRDFVEGVDSLQAYLRSNDEGKLSEANARLTESLTLDPEFAPAQYYKAARGIGEPKRPCIGPQPCGTAIIRELSHIHLRQTWA